MMIIFFFFFFFFNPGEQFISIHIDSYQIISNYNKGNMTM